MADTPDPRGAELIAAVAEFNKWRQIMHRQFNEEGFRYGVPTSDVAGFLQQAESKLLELVPVEPAENNGGCTC